MYVFSFALDCFSDLSALHVDLFVIVEEEHDDGTSTFGVAVADTSNGELMLVHIEDDERLSSLETLLVRFRPVEVHHDRGITSAKTRRLLATTLQSPFYSFATFAKSPVASDLLQSFQRENKSKLIDMNVFEPFLLQESSSPGYAIKRVLVVFDTK